MTKESGFKRRVRARMASTGESYAGARAQLHRPRALHITNGDSAALSLRAAGLEGEVLAWTGVHPDGPVAMPDPAQAAAVAAHGGAFVLWFEADLYDQLLLIQVLVRLREQRVEPAHATLVSIGEYPGRAHFGGLGELQPAELAGLLPQAVRLTPESFDLAHEAWRAFTAPRPRALPAIARAVSPELRFVGDGFGRLMQEYPSRIDGLSLSERRVLQAVDEGAHRPREVFLKLWQRERRPFLGDSSVFAIVTRLLEAAHPLIAPGPLRDRLRLTPIGREVLAGSADHVRLNGIDRWIGGCHLTGAEDWRYDERLETVTKGP